jgi:hypothetical protein
VAKLQDIVTPQLQFTEGVAAPDTPDSGVVRIYAKDDGLLYSKDDAGTERLLSSGATTGLLDETAHDLLDHTGLNGIPSIAGLLDETIHDLLDHTGLTGIPSTSGLLDETAHDLLDHTGLTGCGGDLSPLTTQGDIIVQGASSPARLGIGTAKQVPRVNAGATALEYVANTRGICFSINNVDLATTQSVAITAPFAMTITGGKLEVGTAPTGAALICDIHKNGTTLWTTQGNRPTIADAGTTAAITAPDVTSIAQGDRLLLMIDQIGSTVAGKDLSLTLYCEVA